MKNAVFWDIKPISYLTGNTVSAYRAHRLMLWKIWGFHGGDYEECRLLGYKKPSSYLTGNTLLFRIQSPTVNALEDLMFSRWWLRRMPSSEIWCHVTLVWTEVSEERIATIIRVTRIGELGTTLAVTNNRGTPRFLRSNAIWCFFVACFGC
jgi:hypothetical protein